ncbi:E3 ubiquitin-protein ligase PRT1 isoform X1 [Dendrobium catenatum]|uniref:E3 ubiquitin-protein ligase PRT1 isoform X1 n=1 Tax=Dendrobium catenatum TaxID=906689 RepID=UPI0009F56F62|nr:E3 ubiquitin-protein ligase PRT1 isoform X1 [Dendrobium catenatum]
MEEETLESSYHPSFQCCVCLDLLFKPVVLACGHMSCFWCVHKAMHVFRASHCAICRQPYIHFPSICQLLHLLVSKMEPVAYKRREKEVLVEESRLDIFSPQFNSLASESGQSDGNGSIAKRNVVDSFVNHEYIRTNISEKVGLQKKGSLDISKEDVLCALCQDLLFRPTVLNCGHVFCESCLATIGSEALKCHVCQSIHPGEFPKICLDLDHVLEEQFPNEYTTRRERLKQLEKVMLPRGGPSSTGVSRNHISRGGHLWLDEDLPKANVGVGCDSCGMYPIIGKRYKCKDCKEAIGFDLCESCYNTSSKLPGRFNQQHKPDHRFELDDSHMLYNILLQKSLSMEEPYQDLYEDHVSVDETVQNENIDSNNHTENGNA